MQWWRAFTACIRSIGRIWVARVNRAAYALAMTRPQKAFPPSNPSDARKQRGASSHEPRGNSLAPRVDRAKRWSSRIVAEADVSPSTLIPNLLNWRKHPKHQQQALSGALDEIGWIQRVIVNKRTGNIIDGHLRVELAIAHKEKTIPVCYVNLSPKEEHIALATFDSVGALAQQDEAAYAKLIEEIGADNPALMSLLAKDEEVDAAAVIGAGDTSSQLTGMEYRVIVDCRDEEQQTELLTRFELEGLPCRALIS